MVWKFQDGLSYLCIWSCSPSTPIFVLCSRNLTWIYPHCAKNRKLEQFSLVFSCENCTNGQHSNGISTNSSDKKELFLQLWTTARHSHVFYSKSTLLCFVTRIRCYGPFCRLFQKLSGLFGIESAFCISRKLILIWINVFN